jgi:hypothetical protein
MKKSPIVFLLLLLGLNSAAAGWDPAAAGDRPSLEKFVSARVGRAAAPPFSFLYGGRAAGNLIAKWKVTEETAPAADKLVRTIVYADPETGLRLTAV